MYTPEHFREVDSARLSKLIRDYPFGMLVTVDEGLPQVNHLPFLFEKRDDGSAVLLGHVAKTNPQWHRLADGGTALVVFQGPNAYVSPAWYESPGVPTWNYAVVHVYGGSRLLDSDSELEPMLRRLTSIHEAREFPRWQPDLTGERRERLLGMIVGFEIRVDRIEGKFKLSQNRPVEDRRNVYRRLADSSNPSCNAVAALMKHE